MRVVAGVDVGNSTTEVVLVRRVGRAFEVVGHARAMTRGEKGSHESLVAAARLTVRLARRHDADLEQAWTAPLRPVRTGCRTLDEAPPDSSPLRLLLHQSVASAAGDDAVVGRPVVVERLAEVVEPGPVVALAGAERGYADVVDAVQLALRRGVHVVGVLTSKDEAVLVSNRLRVPLPVVDQVAVDEALAAELVAVEARPHGRPLKKLTDPFWTAAAFGLAPESRAVQVTCTALADSSYAVVALAADRTVVTTAHASEPTDLVRWSDGSVSPLGDAVDRLAVAAPGSAAGLTVSGVTHHADDLFAVHLGELARAASSRRGTVCTSRVVTALLRAGADDGASAGILEEQLGVPVGIAESEMVAGRRGALSTPGAPGDALVVDVGGGTIDVSDGRRRCVAAGAGELLTRLTAEGLGVPSGTAEYVKRGPALHVVAPQVVLDEKGARAFLDAPVSPSAVGALCAQGPVGLVPFDRQLGLGEWRSWRQAAKMHSLGRNVARALRAFELNRAASLVLVGGPAEDDELISVITEGLPPGTTVGRGNVAGSLGHRCAVAYGLAVGGGPPS